VSTSVVHSSAINCQSEQFEQFVQSIPASVEGDVEGGSVKLGLKVGVLVGEVDGEDVGETLGDKDGAKLGVEVGAREGFDVKGEEVGEQEFTWRCSQHVLAHAVRINICVQQ